MDSKENKYCTMYAETVKTGDIELLKHVQEHLKIKKTKDNEYCWDTLKNNFYGLAVKRWNHSFGGLMRGPLEEYLDANLYNPLLIAIRNKSISLFKYFVETQGYNCTKTIPSSTIIRTCMILKQKTEHFNVVQGV